MGRPVVTDTRPRLSRADWLDAALAAMAAQGTTGVNVEQLARSLGATKGSFYHHFENRDSLLAAALDRFTEIVQGDLEAVATVADPRERIIEGSVVGIGTDLDGFVDLALSASADDPLVAEALSRITELRLAWLSSALTEAGVPADAARSRAESGLASYLGLFHLQRVQGRRFDDDHLREHIVSAVDAMLR